MTKDEEADEIVRRLSKTDEERRFEDLFNAIRELSLNHTIYVNLVGLQKEDGNKERTGRP